jgi:hypothetical protein
MDTPVTFRACASAYAVLCSPWVVLGLLSILTGALHDPGGWHDVAIMFGIAAVFATWLAWFRLEILVDGFSYRAPIGSTRHVLFSEVSGVQRASGPPLGIVVKLSDGSLMRVNFKVLPKRAGDLLAKRLHYDA